VPKLVQIYAKRRHFSSSETASRELGAHAVAMKQFQQNQSKTGQNSQKTLVIQVALSYHPDCSEVFFGP
jgi:hypothetical protein